MIFRIYFKNKIEARRTTKENLRILFSESIKSQKKSH